jgi:predicted metal-dependent phosphoesterase TrpH
MLVDLHTHSAGISKCCKATAQQNIDRGRETGIEGFVLTNHYTHVYLGDGTAEEFARRYVEEYRLAKAYADSVDFKLLFGVEVSIRQHWGVHLLVLGVSENFVLEHPTVYDYSQEELFQAVHQAGGVLIQAHPLRKGSYPLDLKYLDGIEVNCHPGYDACHLETLAKTAAEAGVILTCGGDYHADTKYRPHCGVYLPDWVLTEQDLARFLKETQEISLCAHEVGSSASEDATFRRGVGLI